MLCNQEAILKLEELLSIFGHLIDSEKVTKFLAQYDSFKVEKPSDGSQYVISEELGVDLLFRPDDGPQGGKSKYLRKCQSAFLYSQGRDDHEQYEGEIPLGFAFSDSREKMIEMHKPERTWKIGQGEVSVDFSAPSHDRWKFDNFLVSAHYNKSRKIMYFIVSTNNA